MQFQRNDKKRSAQPASEGRPAKDLQPTKSIRSSTARDSFSQTPHMRGKDPDIVLLRGIAGITPAYAGKRWYTRCAKKLPQDHPRMCGEKECRFVLWKDNAGSPPRMRGKVRAIVDAALEGGITPAYAGKRACCWGHPAAWGDHPRMCGEKASSTSPMKCLKGSPPRMRGKATRAVCDDVAAGITPACAGKSYHCFAYNICDKDHPRVCGEKGTKTVTSADLRGSPPHVRGKDPILHLRQCLQVRPDHARHLVHLSFLRA